MTKSNKKQGLGRGLSALFGEEEAAAAQGEAGGQASGPSGAKPVPIDLIHPNRTQPRRHYDEEALEALAESIARQGVLQPLVVRPHPSEVGQYEIVAGERRWRAAQRARLDALPVVVRDLDDRTTLEIALVENVQREDLTPLEEADAYSRLIEDFGYSQSELGKAVGKSRSHIANTLRLLGLPDPIKRALDEGRLSAGHGRALLTAENPIALAETAVSEGWSVRETERRAQNPETRPPAKPRGASGAVPKDADTLALERDLSYALGLKVILDHRGEGGHLSLHYTNLDQLDDLIARLRGPGGI
ncbi:MAG: ParB/RepB/Spo0J family partition protein [Kiloniellales bacterium]